MRTIGAGARRRWRSLLWAAVCGVAMAFAFPPTGLWWLAPLTVAGFVGAVSGRSWRLGAACGAVFGVAFGLVEFYWVHVIGWDAWPLLALAEGAFFIPLGAGCALLGRVRGAAVWQACLWVAQEAARDRVPLGGFSWARLAFSQTDTVYTRLAEFGGAPLVTFATALSGTGLAAVALRARREDWRRPRVVAVLVAAGWLVAVVAGPVAAALSPRQTGSVGDGSKPLTFALVQGNVPRIGLDYLGQQHAVIKNHVDETLKLAALINQGKMARPDVVLWPENATDLDPYKNPDVSQAITAAARAVGAPIMVGAVVDLNSTQWLNESIVWSPTSGPGQFYAKQHLVPFGEYVPFRSLLTTVFSELNRSGQFVPGHWPGVLTMAGAKIGTVICFEVSDDGLVRDAITGGGQVLAVPTNNADYNYTWEVWQQLAIEQLRAVETDRTVLVPSTSGISAVIAPDGTITASAGQFQPALLEATVGLRSDLTLAMRVGAWPEWILSGIGVIAWAAVGVAGWWARRRRGGAVPQPAQSAEAAEAVTPVESVEAVNGARAEQSAQPPQAVAADAPADEPVVSDTR